MSFVLLPKAERSPEICLLAEKLYPDETAKRPDLIPEKREKRLQRVFALQDDGGADGGKVHLSANDGLLQREAVEH